VIPVAYGDGVADRIRAARPAAWTPFIDTYGDGYVELAFPRRGAGRIDTIVDFAAAAKHGVKDGGGSGRAGAKVLANWRRPDRRRTPRGADRDVLPAGAGPRAYTELERRHTPQDRPQA